MFIFLLILTCSLLFNQNTSGKEAGKSTSQLASMMSNIITFREDGKINIPSSIKHIKLDIGLSYSAPMAQYWLNHEEDLYVFGFEPNPASVASILEGAVKRLESHGDPLEKKFIGNSFFLIPCALGLANSSMIKFYVTNDCGCSSLYQPKYFGIERVIEVPIFSLKIFFDLFPFDSHPVIDYIKIDAQGSDLDIVKSAGHYLTERVVYITLEPENTQYKNTTNSHEDIDAYMKKIGFKKFISNDTCDPTYFNPHYSQYVKENKVQIYQRG